MDDYTLMERDFITKQYIENNFKLFIDIQDNQRRDFKEASNKFRTVRNIREFILQRVYSDRGIPLPNKKQEGNSSESNKTRVLEFV